MSSDGKQFEDQLAAFFHCYGCYVEKNLHFREGGDEFLEIDLMITDYPPDSAPRIFIAEAKSGKWGFHDIFKIRGWMDFIDTETHGGFFIVDNSRTRDVDSINKKVYPVINIRVIEKDKLNNVLQEEFKRESCCNEIDLAFWRYSHLLERRLLRRLNTWKKSTPDSQCYPLLEQYYQKIHDDVFFTDNVVDRLLKLYGAFELNPYISAKCGNEYSNRDPAAFNEDITRLPEQIYKKTYYDCEFTPIQISTFIEHKARLMILKSAVDYILYGRYGLLKKIESRKFSISIKGFKLDFDTWEWVPLNFRNALKEISDDEYLHRYPIFWQWFLWIFGGFIIESAKDLEFELLSEKTGIPVDEIPRALEVYELLFPLKGGGSWFLRVPGYGSGNILLLKLFSVPFMGLGVLYRLYNYFEDMEKWDVNFYLQLRKKLGLSISESNELRKWMRLTLHVLKH